MLERPKLERPKLERPKLYLGLYQITDGKEAQAAA